MKKTLLLFLWMAILAVGSAAAQHPLLTMQGAVRGKNLHAFKRFNENPKKHVLPQLAPKSPNIASFERYGDIPVSMSTGIPQVKIPLAEVKVDGLTIPLELSYHNNGFKPKDIASWVGYGWNLQPVGAITWDVQGINDFSGGGLFGGYGLISNYRRGLLNTDQQTQLFEDIIEGYQDSEFDQFDLSLLGAQHLFYYDTLQKLVMTPKSDLVVRTTSSGFKVIDHQGNQFFFEDVESSTSADASDYNFRPGGESTTFLISRIITKNGRLIRFRYRFFYYSFNQPTPVNRHRELQQNEDLTCPANGIQYADTHVSQEVMLLDSIIYDDGYVKFNRSSANRQDLSMFYTDGVPSLESIKIVNNRGKVVNQFNLLQSYYGTATKLRLDGVQEQVGSTIGRKWEFAYFPGGDVSFGTYAVDHWGYYNGQSNSTILPEADYEAMFLPTMGSADKTSSFAHSKGGILKSIKFPTGGSTEFEWEANQMRVPTKAYIESLSDFLKWKKTDFPVTYVTLADGNSQINPAGTFTLTQTTMVTVDYYYELDPGYVGDAAVVFTGPTYGATKLFQAVNSYDCRPAPYCAAVVQVELEPGTYTYDCYQGMDTYASPSRTLSSRVNISYSYIDPNLPVPPFELPGGRIKRIISRDSTLINPPVIKEYVYHDTVTNVSFKNIPNYLTYSTVKVSNEILACFDCGQQVSISGENVAPTAGTNEYSRVTELYDSSGRSGKTEYVYSLSSNIQGDPVVQPQVKPFNTFWTSGNLLSKAVYKKDGSGFTKVAETINTYAETEQSGFMPGMKVGYSSYCNLLVFGGMPTRTYRINPVHLNTARYFQSKAVERSFKNDTIERIDNFLYNSPQHLQLSERQTFDSKEQLVREIMLYPKDYANRNLATTGDALSIKKLADTNVIVPIETIRVKRIAGIDYVIGATLIIYRNDKVTPAKEYGLKSTAPIALSTFTQSSINSSGVLIMDPGYEERILFSKVDIYGNIVEMQRKDDMPVTLIYDYNKMYLVAEASGADSQSVAFTSFEDGTGNWNVTSSSRVTTDAITGSNSFNLNAGQVSKSGLLAGKVYIVIYWSQSATPLTIAGTLLSPVLIKQVGNWRCWMHKVTSTTTITLSGTGIIDHALLYPEGAKVTTWCYEPLVGITAHCTPNNVLTFYEYDDIGRLILVRDQNKNIIRKVEYRYNVSE